MVGKGTKKEKEKKNLTRATRTKQMDDYDLEGKEEFLLSQSNHGDDKEGKYTMNTNKFEDLVDY
jgi:hypothetical protein